MGYVGNQQAKGFVQRPTKQDLTGATGTSLTLSHAVSKEEDIDLYINNVKQEPTTAYTVADTAVTLTGSVVATDDIYVVYNSLALQTVVPPDGSVTSAKLASGAAASNLGTSVNLATIKDSTGTNTAMTIDSSGNVTSQNPLSVTDPIIVVAYSTTTFSSTGILIWNNKAIDTANAYSTSTGQFTAPRAGYYDIGFQYLFRGSSGSYHRVNVRKNNTKVHVPSHSDATMIYTNVTAQIMQGARTIVECAVNDTLDVYIQAMQSPSDIYGNANCHNQLVIKYIG